ncbi:MAG: glycosyltransferase family 4 protein [Anaerolineae bacterium]
MRIAFIGPFGLTPKSTMRVRAVPLARALLELGHAVTIVMPPWHTKEGARTWSEDGINYIYVPISRIPLLGHLVTTSRLLKAALAARPDVIHFFKPKAHSGLSAYLLWILKKLSLHMRLVLDEDDWEGAGGWNEVEPYPSLLKRFFSWQEHWGLSHCDALTVASRALQTIAWSHGVPSQRVFYLPNGAPLFPGPKQDMRRTLSLENTPVVLVYSRFVEFDPDRLAKIWRLIIREIPAARLLVVGEALEPAKQQRLARLFSGDLGQTILHPGWVPISDLPDYFRCADLALFLSDDTLINRCKCSVKLTDLLVSGVPVIAEAVGQNSEYIEHNVTGWLIKPGDNEAVARAVVSTLNDLGALRKTGSMAREKMMAELSWEKLAQTALQAYSSSTSP